MGAAAAMLVELNVLRLFDDPPSVALPEAIQLLGDRGLTVRPHRPAGMRFRVDEKGLAVLPDNEASVMRMAFAVHPLPGAESRST